MKHFFAGLFILVSVAVPAQFNGASQNVFSAAEFGITNFHAWNLNAEGNGVGHRYTQFTTFGLSFTAPVGGRFGEFADGTVALHFFRPNWMEWYTDSSSLTERGWEIMTSLFGIDLIRNQRIDFVVAPGVYWGNVKLLSESRGGGPFSYRYTNPFIAPMARADLRVVLGRIVIGTRFTYRYDLTNDAWKNKSGGPDLPGFHFRDAQYMFYIGWLTMVHQ